jgi:hypothetical protein
VLDQGRIVEEGKPNKLLEKNLASSPACGNPRQAASFPSNLTNLCWNRLLSDLWQLANWPAHDMEVARHPGVFIHPTVGDRSHDPGFRLQVSIQLPGRLGFSVYAFVESDILLRRCHGFS